MKKRILSMALALTMCFTMLPTAAFAEGTPESADSGEVATCICETKCTEGEANPDCPVCGAEDADLTLCTGTEQAESFVTSSNPEEENTLTEAQQAFVAAVSALDKAALLELANAYKADPTDDTETAFYAAYDKVEGVDGTSASELYVALLEDEQAGVADSYAILQDIIGSTNAILGVDVSNEAATYEVTYDENGIGSDGSYEPAVTAKINGRDTYQIENAGNLAWFSQEVKVNTGGTPYKWNAVLTADIDLSSVCYPASDGKNEKSWLPIGRNSAAGLGIYCGIFDGQGHTISNLYINDTTNYSGLFSRADESGKKPQILNLNLTNVNVTGKKWVGAIIGYYNGKPLCNCTVQGGTISGTNYVGGIVGDSRVSFFNCLNTAAVSGNDSVGGILGQGDDSIIANCLNVGSVTATSTTAQYVGAVCGMVTYGTGTVSNTCYIAGRTTKGGNAITDLNSIPFHTGELVPVTEEDVKSGKATYLLNGDQKDIQWYQNIDNGSTKDDYPVLDSSHGIVYKSGETYSNTGTSEIVYTNGFAEDGSYQKPAQDENNYYLIVNAGNLYWFANAVNTGDKDSYLCAKLTQDVVDNASVLTNGSLTSDTTNLRTWTPIGYQSETDSSNFVKFRGIFDGNGHTISGLYYDGNAKYAGLFGYVVAGPYSSDTNSTGNEANIKNLGILDSYFKTTGTTVGAICGYNYGAIENCYNNGSVVAGGEATDYVGGICGWNAGYRGAFSCWNSGAVSGGKYRGGICGANGNGTVIHVTGPGFTDEDGTGDIEGGTGSTSGSMIATIKNCYNSYETTTIGYMGGTLGATHEEINSSNKTADQFASGEVTYLLNGGTSTGNLTWYQNVDTSKENYPTFDNTHSKVYKLTCTKYGQTDSTLFYSNGALPSKTHESYKWVDANNNEVTSVTADAVLFEKGNKMVVSITGLSAATGLTYNGNAQNGYTGTAVCKNGDADVTNDCGTLLYTYYKSTGENTWDSGTTTAPTNAGRYKLVVSVADTNGTYAGSTDIFFTVDQKTVTVAAGTYTVSKIYDGTNTTGTVSGALSVTDILSADSGVSVQATPVAYSDVNVGGQTAMNVTIVLDGDTNGNYTLGSVSAVSVPCSITKATLTVDGTAAASAVYGTKLNAIAISGVTAKLNSTAVDGTWAFSSETVLDAGNKTAYTATFTPTTGAGNYNTLTKEIVPTISKTTYMGTKTDTSSAKYGAAQTFDLSTLTLPAGYAFGAITTTDENAVLNGTPTVSGTILSYMLDNDAAKVGKTATITLPVTSTNFTSFDLTITVTVMDKAEQSNFKFAADTQSKTYGSVNFTVTATGAVEGSTVTYTSSNATVATVNESTGEVQILKAGSTTITATASATTDYKQGTASYSLTINPKELTITGLTATNRDYANENTTVTLTGGTLTGVVGTDAVSASMPTTGTIANADAGTDKTVTVTKPELSGAAKANYTLADISGITVNITPLKENTPAAPTINYTDETLGTTATLKWKTTGTYVVCAADMAATAFGWDGNTAVTVSFITPASGKNHADSDPVSVTIPARPDAPVTTAFTVTKPTSTHGTDGKLSATNGSYQYKISSGNWTDWNGLELTKITDGTTYTIRNKATSTAFASKSIDVLVAAKTGVTINATAATGLIYNGSAQNGLNGAVTVDGNHVPVSNLVYLYENVGGTAYSSATAPTNAGEYKLTISVPADNATYTGSKEINFTIAKKKIDVPAASTTVFTYNGTEQTYTLANSTEYTLSNSKRTNAGTQAVTVALADTANTEWAETLPTYTFTIAKASLMIRWENTTPVYTGAAQKPEVSVTNRFGNDVVVVSIPDSKTAAGTYIMTAQLSGAASDNYTLANPTASFTIQKAPVIFAVTGNTVAQGNYTGSSVTVSTSVDGFNGYSISYLKDGTAVTPSAVGNYDIVATITDSNYRHASKTDGGALKVGTLTIYENEKPAVYTVSFGGGDGATGSVDALAEAQAGTLRILPANSFIKSGFKFLGWMVNGKTYQPGESFLQPASNVEVVAKWQQLYEIKGSVTQKTESGTSVNVAGAVITLTLGSDEVAQAVTDTSGNYTFGTTVTPGVYNLRAEKDGIIVTSGVEIVSASEAVPMVLPAQKTNSVVVVAAGTPAVVVGELDNYADDDKVYTSEDATVVKAGGTVEVKAAVSETPITEETKGTLADIKGKAESNEKVGLFLDIDLNKTVTDASGNQNSDLTKKVTETNNLLSFTINLPGELQGKTSYVVYRKHGNEVQKLTEGTTGERIEVNADKTVITVYAKYFSTYGVAYGEAFTVSFDGNGGTPTAASMLTDEGNVLASLPSASRTGYSFDGWYTAASGGDKITKATVFSANTTVYAHWASNTTSGGGGGGTTSYTLTFDTNGGSAISKVSKSSGTTIDLSAYKPTKSGYTFDGWYTDAKLTDKVTSVKLTKSMTVYAKWTEDAAVSELPFTDVASNAYYYDAVKWAVEQGVTSGTTATTFAPGATCTRAQTVTFLWRAMGSPEPTATVNPFTDVASSAYYHKAVLWAVEKGITVGTSATTFAPDATVTRAQVATFLWRAAGTPAATTASTFTDVPADAYYAAAVLWAAEKGITSGTSATTFSPANDCTRAQIVTFLYRYLSE